MPPPSVQRRRRCVLRREGYEVAAPFWESAYACQGAPHSKCVCVRVRGPGGGVRAKP